MKKTIFMLTMVVSLMALLLTNTSCKDKDYFDPEYQDPTVGTDPTNLSFSTTQEVKLELNYGLENGFIADFELYAENPYKKVDNVWVKRDDLTSLAAGFSISGTQPNRTIPTFVKELYLYSSSPFVPLMHASIENGVATFNQVSLETGSVSDTRTIGNKSVNLYLKPTILKTNDYYRPDIDLTETFPATVATNIGIVFPNDKKADAQYYADASMYLQQGAGDGNKVDVWVSVIASEGTYNNSLSYFCFDGNKTQLAALSATERNKLKIINIFQYAKLNTGTNGLKAGQYVKLKYYNKETDTYEDQFPVGVTIGWVMHSNAFREGDSASNSYYKSTVSNSQPVYYSVPSWNPEANNKNHTIVFKDKVGDTDYICFGFEDMPNEKISGEGPGDADCNDVMFHVRTNPNKAIDPPPYIPTEGEKITTQKSKGIIAFEDNWPRRGDYDMNDVVARYNSTVTIVQKTLDGAEDGKAFIRQIDDQFSLIHTGANYHNSFKIKIDGISTDQIKSITMNNAPITPIPVSGGNSVSGIVLEVCPLVSTGTSQEGGVIDPYRKLAENEYANYFITIEFKEGELTQEAYASATNKGIRAPYNPYISPSPHLQVHLPNYTPAWDEDMASQGYLHFNTAADRSNQVNLWYISGENNAHPFAINLSGITEFTIPAEYKEITYTYPKYQSWVDNGCGETDSDWYLPENVSSSAILNYGEGGRP